MCIDIISPRLHDNLNTFYYVFRYSDIFNIYFSIIFLVIF